MGQHPALSGLLELYYQSIIQENLTMTARITSSTPLSAGRNRFIRKMVIPWLFLLPIFAINLVVILGPSIGSVYYSLTDWSGIGKAEFIGLANFQRLLGDYIYWDAFLNNIKWTAIFLVVPIGLALLGAALLAPIRRGQMVYRVAFFIPYILSSVAVAHIWHNLLHPRYGLTAWLVQHGAEWANVNVWGNERVVLYGIMMAGNWQYWGFLLVIFLAAMQSINPEFYEAARLDGANRWQEFRHVTIPGIRSTLAFMLMMTIIWTFLIFDFVYILTQGGPNHASEMLGTYAYKAAFLSQEAGYGAAIGLTVSLISACVLLGFRFLRRQGWEI
jgi:raffinose/stachyose/melibiose transport system permease protein